MLRDSHAFPSYMDVKGEGGAFFYDLKNPNLTILEDGNRVPVDELVAAKPGTQFVIAISPASAFNIRDSLGNTRYDYMLNTINTWAEILAPTANDSISLVTPGGNLLNGSEDPAELIQMLQTFEPNYDNTTANLDVLSRAVDLAADTPPRTGMGRVVLFLTAAPTDDTIDVIRGISDRALAQDVRVMVWLLDSSANFETEASLALRELAELSGGIFYPFSGVEALPEIDTYLEPLRYVYKFAYQSTITSAGAFPISIEIQYEETTITTDSYDIEVLVQAPNPIFIDPPEEINRTFDVEYGNQTENLVPAQKQIEILIEFNDDVQRNVVRSSMYINEELAAENLSSPFNAFTWDLKEITESGVYSIRFEVEDEFGLVGSSLPSEINVVVEETPNDLRVFIDRYGTGLIFLLAALIGGFFCTGLIYFRALYAKIDRRKVSPT